MFRNCLVLIALAFMVLTQPAHATDDLLVDGVPLPADASIAAPTGSSTALQQRWSGVWVAPGTANSSTFDMPPGKGHFVLNNPDLWSGPIDRYLKSLGPEEKH